MSERGGEQRRARRGARDSLAARASTPTGATLALGLGCASSLPVAITLPAEARVRQSPTLLLASSTCGAKVSEELLCPMRISSSTGESSRTTILSYSS